MTHFVIIRVLFRQPVRGRRDYYFGSIAAIFDMFTPDEVGTKLNDVWNSKITAGNPLVTDKAVISKEVLHRKSHK